MIKRIKKKTGSRNFFRGRDGTTERKRAIYYHHLRFFEGKTQMEVAEQINISQAQVSRLEKNALKIMRKYLLGK